jgi:hypothetical protein
MTIRHHLSRLRRVLVLAASLCCSATAAYAEIVFLAPPPSQVPPGAWAANAPGISYGTTTAGYALQRSQAWRMQNRNSTPTAQNYWLVLPGTSGAYGYGYSGGSYYSDFGSDRAASTRAHVARANAYRMKLFER